jgi:hypothetical protein
MEVRPAGIECLRKQDITQRFIEKVRND